MTRPKKDGIKTCFHLGYTKVHDVDEALANITRRLPFVPTIGMEIYFNSNEEGDVDSFRGTVWAVEYDLAWPR